LLSLASILRQVRLFRGRDDTDAVSDGELLRRFQTNGDEAAFELLVWRHGPMVLGACRRVLRDDHAAEDAFQATFLTLARKAGSIGVRDAVAGWLYTVAHRVAVEALQRRVRREALERPEGLADAEGWGYLPADEPARREEGELVRAEVEKLPDAFRAVVVLCCLEGRTRAEAAQQLGVPAGTVESRLVRARERLRRGLAARGLALAAAPLTSFLSDHIGELVKVPPVLVTGTMHLILLVKIGALTMAQTAVQVAEHSRRASSAFFRLGVAAVATAVVSLAVVVLASPAREISPPLRSESSFVAPEVASDFSDSSPRTSSCIDRPISPNETQAETLPLPSSD
jgi:RNA polymerase sigma factor (sigma-70 family)